MTRTSITKFSRCRTAFSGFGGKAPIERRFRRSSDRMGVREGKGSPLSFPNERKYRKNIDLINILTYISVQSTHRKGAT